MSGLRRVLVGILFIAALAALSLLGSGCSAGKSGLLQITPQQYFYSAKEQLETIDERAYEIKDLEEIIRVLENAEKDAKASEIMDKSRLYLVLANTLKARKQYLGNALKGQYLANRPEPFFALDVKPVQETLRTAKKWLRSCEAQFKTDSVRSDLLFVTGLFYSQKMLTQRGPEQRDSLWTAVRAFRQCLGRSPDYQSDFRLFGRVQTPREVKLRLAECLALGGHPDEAWGIISDYEFTPLADATPTDPRADHAWLYLKGLTLAMMGAYEEAAQILGGFKIVPPQDFPTVEEALWVLEGVYDRLKETTGDEKFGMEARIVASLLKKLKGPYSKDKYTTAAHLFPRWLPGDLTYFEALRAHLAGDFAQAREKLAGIQQRGIMSRGIRPAARILALEADLFGGFRIGDELIEEVLGLAFDPGLTPLQKERLGYLLARYVLAEDKDFGKGKLEGEGQAFFRAALGKPWALAFRYERGRAPGTPVGPRPAAATNGNGGQPTGEEAPPAESASLVGEMYANRPDDWIVSVNLNLVELPQLALVGKGRLVGREEEGKGWIFKGEDIDGMRRGGRYLVVLEFDNSESEKSIQGVLLNP
ncbi:MAG: hypothetical protein GX442_18010 [Candidatus Riflebacteria bacterium]|nr:hypothetical protein [Candidatus Riflebacteria bacterium]